MRYYHVYSRVGVRLTIITNQSMSSVLLFTNITNKTVNCKFTKVIISKTALNYIFVTLFLRILDVTVPPLICIKHGTNLDILFVFLSTIGLICVLIMLRINNNNVGSASSWCV